MDEVNKDRTGGGLGEFENSLTNKILLTSKQASKILIITPGKKGKNHLMKEGNYIRLSTL